MAWLVWQPELATRGHLWSLSSTAQTCASMFTVLTSPQLTATSYSRAPVTAVLPTQYTKELDRPVSTPRTSKWGIALILDFAKYQVHALLCLCFWQRCSLNNNIAPLSTLTLLSSLLLLFSFFSILHAHRVKHRLVFSHHFYSAADVSISSPCLFIVVCIPRCSPHTGIQRTDSRWGWRTCLPMSCTQYLVHLAPLAPMAKQLFFTSGFTSARSLRPENASTTNCSSQYLFCPLQTAPNPLPLTENASKAPELAQLKAHDAPPNSIPVRSVLLHYHLSPKLSLLRTPLLLLFLHITLHPSLYAQKVPSPRPVMLRHCRATPASASFLPIITCRVHCLIMHTPAFPQRRNPCSPLSRVDNQYTDQPTRIQPTHRATSSANRTPAMPKIPIRKSGEPAIPSLLLCTP